MTNNDEIKDSYDLVVIGAGPGGYVAAIRAAQLGMDVACIESNSREGGLGGVCLNWGCIPAKAILESAMWAQHIKNDAAEFGIRVKDYELDLGAAVERSREVSERLTRGVRHLLNKNEVTAVFGRGSLTGEGTVAVDLEDGDTKEIAADAVILATGSRPKTFPGFEFDQERVISSRDALELKKVPNRIIIVGAGATGMEFADVFNAFGSEVTIIEALPQLLPLEDPEVAEVVARSFKKRDIRVMTGTKVKSLEKLKTKLKVTVEGGGENGDETLDCDVLLMAVGRVPNVEDMGLEAAGVELTDRGWIRIDEFCRTTADGIYAIGDVAGPPMLAHKGSHEGILAVEQIAGLEPRPLDPHNIPACTYCHPEVASIGRTEEQAREDGFDVKTGKFPFTANGRALTAGAPDGLVKIVVDTTYGEVLGVHMVGHNVTELIAEAGIGRTLETTVEEVAHTVHAHPTLAETVMEAALAAMDQAIHI